ncbi:MAG: hypothetical protein KatS3mg110_0135 [Pirellulaceae bacterium]|nr:MAG: hypothetical protein KatS3mg110_0135 [Pirellulaceae bacterium]
MVWSHSNTRLLAYCLSLLAVGEWLRIVPHPQLLGEEPKPAETSIPVPLEIDTSGMIRLSRTEPIWIDRQKKWVVVDGEVCLRSGTLEMFACPKGTKEHESIVSVPVRPFLVHAGLLAVGAKPGKPVQFVPQYVPASGTEIAVWVLWKDKEGKPHRAPAQQWIRDVRSKQPMPHAWVFAGSSVRRHPDTGQSIYQADGGDFICVSNFPTAMLDLPVESSQAEGELLFEAFTEHIPEVGTPVRLVLIPKLAQ